MKSDRLQTTQTDLPALNRSAKFIAPALALLLAACALASDADQGQDKREPSVPANLQVPDGNIVHFHAYAVGVQIYDWNGSSWVFRAPEAVLFAASAGNGEIGIHYAGPTWESESGSTGATTDQRGRLRVYDNPAITNAAGGDGSDIGAFDLQSQSITLAAPGKSSDNVVLTFPAESGQRYRIERRDALTAGSWITVADNLSGTAGTVELSDPGAASQPQRFYRAVTLP